jgi:hypothetical protein
MRPLAIGGLALVMIVVALTRLSPNPALTQAEHRSQFLPNPALTPGAVRTTDVSDICATGTKALRHWSRERDDRILREYGLPIGPHPSYEIDHLIPLGIGGADEDSNLWPEERRSLVPEWNAERKDKLEWTLRELVCSGRLEVTVAQHAIRDNWIEAWRQYVGGGERR